MIDISKLKYRLIALLETGERLDITNVCEDIMWAEYENELSMGLSFSACNAVKNGQYLMELIKPNTVIFILSNYAGGWDEVARGKLNSWEPQESNSSNVFDGAANDILYDLQQSQEYRFITDGTSTKSAITTIFEDWGIKMGVYDGPDKSHKKKVYKSNYVGDEIVDLLDDAKKKGAKKCFIRARGDVVDIVPRGTNSTIYALRADTNVTTVKSKISTQSIVTRVVVMSKADDNKRQSIEATVDGQTQYGIRQRIITRGNEESLAEAKKTAQEILDEDGNPDKKYELPNLPDVPPLRKGDKIYIHAATLDGFYYVKCVTHYASKRTMTIKVEEIDDADVVEETPESSGGEFEVGDRVILNGAVYRDSYGKGQGKTFTDYEDVIRLKVSTDRECPYHFGTLGWVYPSSIKKV